MEYCSLFNLENLSILVASINALVYLVLLMYDVIFLNEEYKKSAHSSDFSGKYAVHSEIILLLVFGIGLCSSVLYLKGMRQKHPGLMKPLLYMTTICIGFASVSFLCFYCAALVGSLEYLNVIIMGFSYFLAIGIFVLFSTPLFQIYQRMCQRAIYPFNRTIRHPEKPVEQLNQ
ncbi:uncharacterized protein LOC105261970 [Musca domestica]|uniref:Uncharacterized protein LOC105261970 n=1 Tax=Musca domestica TaxID=7370 RepID=A0A1I8NJX0_MUSDO|nr:uncharacterized protein LOC105261970 [Musca domestica]